MKELDLQQEIKCVWGFRPVTLVDVIEWAANNNADFNRVIFSGDPRSESDYPVFAVILPPVKRES